MQNKTNIKQTVGCLQLMVTFLKINVIFNTKWENPLQGHTQYDIVLIV